MRIQLKEQEKKHDKHFSFIPISKELINSEMCKELKKLNIRYNIFCIHAILCMLLLFAIRNVTFEAKNLCLTAGIGSVIIDMLLMYKIHKNKMCIMDVPTEQELKNFVFSGFQKAGKACMVFSNGIAVLNHIPKEEEFDKMNDAIKEVLRDYPDAKNLSYIIDSLKDADTRQQAFLLAELIQYFLAKGENDILYYDTKTIPTVLDEIYFC